MLNNLLTNAARHSPEATPIRVAAAPDGAHVGVSVADDGEGVAPERLPHLFHRHAGIEEGGGGGSGLLPKPRSRTMASSPGFAHRANAPPITFSFDETPNNSPWTDRTARWDSGTVNRKGAGTSGW